MIERLKNMQKNFEIAKVHEAKTTSNERLFVKCETKKGDLIAFWGLRHSWELKKQTIPFGVSCKVKKTREDVLNKTKVRFWVLENQELKFSPIKKK